MQTKSARDAHHDSLFDQTIATFEDDHGHYDQADAHGFIRLHALRLKMLALRKQRQASK